MLDSGHINYIRNPAGNAGPHCVNSMGISSLPPGESVVKIYPNPVSEELNVQIVNNDEKISKLTLLNILGEDIMEKKTGQINTDKTTLTLTTLAAGIYFLTVQTKEKITTRKIIKQ